MGIGPVLSVVVSGDAAGDTRDIERGAEDDLVLPACFEYGLRLDTLVMGVTNERMCLPSQLVPSLFP